MSAGKTCSDANPVVGACAGTEPQRHKDTKADIKTAFWFIEAINFHMIGPLMLMAYFMGAAPPLVAFSRSSCSRRSCSKRVRRLAGAALGIGAGVGVLATAAGAGALAFGGIGTSIRNS